MMMRRPPLATFSAKMPPAVRFDGAARDRQSQAEAARVRRLAAIERLEHRGQAVGGDPRSVVAYGNAQPTRFGQRTQVDFDATAGGRVLQRVAPATFSMARCSNTPLACSTTSPSRSSQNSISRPLAIGLEARVVDDAGEQFAQFDVVVAAALLA